MPSAMRGPRVATAPVNWNNDDVPDIRPHLAYADLLREMRQAGYTATEFGSALPLDPDVTRQALAREGLTMVSAFCALPLRDGALFDHHGERLDAVAALLKALGADTLVLSDAIQAQRSAWAGRAFAPDAPRLTADERTVFLDNVHAVCRRLGAMGMRVAFHHHAATYVEAPDEVRWLMDESDPALLGLCLDTGHLTYGGGDAVQFARTYGGRVRHVHLKDVDRDKLQRARTEAWSFEQALRAYLFPELGQGMVDFPGVLEALRDVGYDGWLVVEQDTQEGSALAAATRNRRYLSEHLGL
jgi:inosose dehydratase